MTMTPTTSAPEYAAAKYTGVAVWRQIDPLRDQVRALQRHEKVELLEDRGNGWLWARLPDGAEGFVRREALQPYSALMAAPASQALAAPHAASAPAYDRTPRSGSGSPYPGAARVALGLTIFAWICLVGGQLAGFGAAIGYDCEENFLSDCSDETSSRVMLYLTFGATSFITALFAFASAYALSLLDHIIESGSIAEPSRVHEVAAGMANGASQQHAQQQDAPNEPVTERCAVCGNIFSAGALSPVNGQRMCRQCAAAAQL